MQSCVQMLPSPWSTCTRSWNVFHDALETRIHDCPSDCSHTLDPCFLLCSKITQCGPVCCNIYNYEFVSWCKELVAVFILSQHYDNILTLRLLLRAFRHLMHQMCYDVVDRKFLLASSLRQWSKIHTMSASSRARSWQYICLFWVFLNKKVDWQMFWSCSWPCSCRPINHRPFASCTWKTCDEWRGCWTHSSFRKCCRKPFRPPHVHHNFWYMQGGCPPSWGQWWTYLS